jgi:membrane protein YqaA with SNARE-associated domain
LKKYRKNILILTIIILSILIWSIFLLFFPPSKIIGFVGIQNTYWLIFLIAAIAGVSTVTSTSYYASVVAFVIGGANPFLIAIFAGLGMTIGDSLFYFLGKKGAQVLPEKIDRYQDKIEEWLQKRPKWIVVIIIYIYTGLSPFPGDLMSIFLGITNFRYKLVIWPIIFGNITLMTIIGLLAQNRIEIF